MPSRISGRHAGMLSIPLLDGALSQLITAADHMCHLVGGTGYITAGTCPTCSVETCIACQTPPDPPGATPAKNSSPSARPPRLTVPRT
jgi:hypothetical protein